MRPRHPSSRVVAARRAVFLGGWILVLVVASLTLALWPSAQRRWRRPALRWWYRGICALCGLTIATRGTIPPGNTHTLCVANHLGYLDIPALGAVMPAHFIAKDTVATWPVVGALTRLAGTFFVHRHKPALLHHTFRHIATQIPREPAPLVFFPEGTSTEGQQLQPFRSPLFAIVTSQPTHWMIQPIAIRYVTLNDSPLPDALRPLCAWYGDMPFFPHLWNFLGLGKLGIELTFLTPYPANTDRKLLAETAEHVIRVHLFGPSPPISERKNNPSPVANLNASTHL